MTILTTIPNGASGKDVRDTLNSILGRLTSVESAVVKPILSSLIIQIGDSIPYASRTNGYSAIKNMGYDSSLVTIDNTYAQDGHSLAQVAADVPGGLASRYDSSKRCIAIVQRVTNDFGNNQSSAATCIALTKTIVNLLRAQGFYVGVGTCLPRTVGSFGWTSANESQRQIYNAWAVANSTSGDYSGHDFVLDFAADPNMGASSAPANTALYIDGTHPTSAGQDYLTPIYRNAVKPWLSAAVRSPSPLVTLSGDVSQNEGASGATTAYTFTATRTNTGTAINVPWVFIAGGTSSSDFVGGTPTGGTLAFSATDTTKTITINVAGDAAAEATETFSVALQAGSGYYLGSVFQSNGVIVDDDTSAGPNYVRLTTLSSNFSETAMSPGYSYAANAYTANFDPAKSGYSSAKLPANADGYIRGTKIGAAGPSSFIIGFSNTATPDGFKTASSGTCLLFCDTAANAFWNIASNGAGLALSAVLNQVTAAQGDVAQVRRSGTSLIAEVSKDGGSTFTPIYSMTAPTGALTPFAHSGNSAPVGAVGPLVGSANVV